MRRGALLALAPLVVQCRNPANLSDEAQSLRRDNYPELPGGPPKPATRHGRTAGDHGQWWESERRKYDLVVSVAVEAECGRGDQRTVLRRRELLGEVSLFAVDERILELAKRLVVPGAIPEKAGPDAIHIAAASVAQCEFLLTWNFRHIANVRIRREVERILANYGYTKTTICTPEEPF